MKNLYPELTDEQRQAMNRFVAEAGTNWRATLRMAWANSRPAFPQDADISAVLQGLRNSHGPSWLATYRHRKESA